MATTKEQTLKIKDFLGISRYYNSSNQPPNKFWAIQNMYSPVKGELALLGGVTDKSGSGYPGATSLKHVQFLKTSIGYTRQLVFFDHDALPTPSAPTAVTATGSAYSGNVDVYLSYVGMGGESAMSAATTVACGGGANIQVTVPTFPTGIVSMNVWVSGVLVAVVSKRMGASLPASVTLDRAPKATGTASVIEFRYTIKDFDVTFTTGGSLESGKIYYFGICPNFSGGYQQPVTTKCGQATLPGVDEPSGRIFSFTVPEGYSKATISFTTTSTRKIIEQRANSAPYEWTENTTDVAGLSAWAFLGTSPNDLMAVGTSNDGIAKPQIQSTSTGLSITIGEVPYNSNITTYKQQSWTPRSTDFSDIYNFITLRVGTAKDYFQYENQADGDSTAPNNPATSGLGIYALTAVAYSSSTAYQIMPARGCGYYSTNRNTNFTQVLAFSSVFVPYSAGQFKVESGTFDSANFLNRRYFVNGAQSPFYTNGYVLSVAPRKKQTPYLPITTCIRLFGGRLVMGGGPNSLFNTSNVVFYAETDDPETWTNTASNTAALAFISALDADSDSIVGLGVYSESLDASGNNAFLVIGKSRSCWTWNGSSSSGAQQIAERTGFASSKAFAITNYGAAFVGRENVYRLLSNGQAQKIGNDIEPILKGLSNYQISTIQVVFHDLHLKIGYVSGSNVDPSPIDTEIWMNLRQDGGDIYPIFSGPHSMKTYSGMAETIDFDSLRDVRVSYLTTKTYLRDDTSSYLNDGSNIAVSIESNDIGFGADEFIKILTQFYLVAKINKAETITLTIKLYDSSSQGKGLDYNGSDGAVQTFTDTMSLPFAGATEIYRRFQRMFASRYRGDLLRFTMSLSTNLSFKVQSMNFLFNIDRRRLL